MKNLRRYVASPIVIICSSLILSSSHAVSGEMDGPIASTPLQQKVNKMTRLKKIVELAQKADRAVSAVKFSPDGNLLATKIPGQKILIWAWRENKVVATLASLPDESRSTTSLLFTPDGRYLISSFSRTANDVVAQVWDTKKWQIVHEIIDTNPGDTTSIALSPSGTYLVRTVFRPPTATGDTVLVYKTSEWTIAWSKRTVPLYPYASAFGADEERFAIAGKIVNPMQWPYSTPKPSFGQPAYPDSDVVLIYSSKKEKLNNVFNHGLKFGTQVHLSWDKNGNDIAIASGEGLSVLDIVKGVCRFDSPPVFESGTNGIEYIPNSSFLIEGAARYNNKVGYLRLREKNRLDVVLDADLNVHSLDVEESGKYIAVGEAGHSSVWQIEN